MDDTVNSTPTTARSAVVAHIQTDNTDLKNSHHRLKSQQSKNGQGVSIGDVQKLRERVAKLESDLKRSLQDLKSCQNESSQKSRIIAQLRESNEKSRKDAIATTSRKRASSISKPTTYDDQRMQRLMSTRANLEAQISTDRSELEDLNEKRKALEAELNDLSIQLESLHSEKNSMDEELNKLSDTRTSIDQQIEDLQGKLNELQEREQELERGIPILTAQHKTKENALAELDKKLKEATTKLQKLNESVGSAQTELKNAEEATKSAKDEKKKLDLALNETKSHSDEALACLNKQQEELKKSSVLKEKMEAGIAELARQEAELRMRVEEYTSQLRKVERDVEDLYKQFDDLTSGPGPEVLRSVQSETAMDTVYRTGERLKRLNEFVTTKHQETEESQRILETLRREYNEAQKQLALTRSDINQEMICLEDLQRRREDMQKQCQTFEERLNSVSRDYSNMVATRERDPRLMAPLVGGSRRMTPAPEDLRKQQQPLYPSSGGQSILSQGSGFGGTGGGGKSPVSSTFPGSSMGGYGSASSAGHLVNQTPPPSDRYPSSDCLSRPVVEPYHRWGGPPPPPEAYVRPSYDEDRFGPPPIARSNSGWNPSYNNQD